LFLAADRLRKLLRDYRSTAVRLFEVTDADGGVCPKKFGPGSLNANRSRPNEETSYLWRLR